MWFQTSPDKIFVGSDKVRQEAISRGIPEDKIVLSGIPVHPGFMSEHRSKAEIRRDLGWRPEATTVLAVGSRRVEHMVDHLDAINDSGYALQLAIVAGGDDALYSKVKEIDWQVPAYPYNYVENLPAMMQASDILVSKAGGLIIAESLACSLPIIMIGFIPGQETGNISYVLEKRVGALAESPQELLSLLAGWLKEGQREMRSISSRAGSTGKPDAAYRIAETIWEAIR
jgi:UDP-N-acetylglucosamine:LPS N-acetylglucosamine transferase